MNAHYRPPLAIAVVGRCRLVESESKTEYPTTGQVKVECLISIGELRLLSR